MKFTNNRNKKLYIGLENKSIKKQEPRIPLVSKIE